VLNRIVKQNFDQYVFDRVDHILSTAGAADSEYGKAVSNVGGILSQLMAIARELEEQQPQLLRLVMEFESAATLESGMAAEIAYREGLKDGCRLRREFITFIRE
jgi:hypothetical protein